MAEHYTKEENSLKNLVQCFYEKSTGDDDKETLTLDEFKKLVKSNFPNLMKDCNPEQLIKSLDTNNDNKIKYSEYWTLIGIVAKQVKREEKKKH